MSETRGLRARLTKLLEGLPDDRIWGGGDGRGDTWCYWAHGDEGIAQTVEDIIAEVRKDTDTEETLRRVCVACGTVNEGCGQPDNCRECAYPLPQEGCWGDVSNSEETT